MDISNELKSDGRVTRGETTRRALMHAAEQLIADHGIENVSVKDITKAADQANPSALQYHFGNLQGLLVAIRAARGEQVRLQRAESVDNLLSRSPRPSLRDVCKLMVEPAFLLAREDWGFRNAIRAFGHEIAFAKGQAGEGHLKADTAGSLQIVALLRNQLADLDERLFFLRLDSALRFVAASMMTQARRTEASSDPHGSVFFNNLVDSVTGLLSAQVSADTNACMPKD